MLQCLLRGGGGVVTVDFDSSKQKLIARIDESKIFTHGKPALGKMLLRLHIYRCTAQVDECREYYEGLSLVDDKCLEWRKIVIALKSPRLLLVQPNTFYHNNKVTLKEYDATLEGIIKSWAERSISIGTLQGRQE